MDLPGLSDRWVTITNLHDKGNKFQDSKGIPFNCFIFEKVLKRRSHHVQSEHLTFLSTHYNNAIQGYANLYRTIRIN